MQTHLGQEQSGETEYDSGNTKKASENKGTLPADEAAFRKNPRGGLLMVKKAAGLAITLLMSCAAATVNADFLTNFSPLPSVGTGFIGSSFSAGDYGAAYSPGFNDGTRFDERIVDVNGIQYYQVTIGEDVTGFAYTYLTRFGGTINSVGNPIGLNLDSGGGEGGAGATSNFANIDDPFGLTSAGFHSSGTGTGTPTAMVFHLKITDGAFVQDVLKDQFGNKPRISTTVSDGAFKYLFTTDMRDLSYSDGATAAPVIIKSTVTDPALPAGAADFDTSMVDQSHITAGQFTFTPGAGWNSSQGYLNSSGVFTPGTYDYIDGGFDNLNTDWASFFNYQDNVDACTHRGGGYNRCPGGP